MSGDCVREDADEFNGGLLGLRCGQAVEFLEQGRVKVIWGGLTLEEIEERYVQSPGKYRQINRREPTLSVFVFRDRALVFARTFGQDFLRHPQTFSGLTEALTQYS